MIARPPARLPRRLLRDFDDAALRARLGVPLVRRPAAVRAHPEDRHLFAPRGLAGLGGATALSKELELAAYALGWHALRPFPGYTGRPHRATAQAGAYFARAIVDRYAALVEDVFAGRARSPRPIMQWSARLSLSGRIAVAPPHAR